MKYDASLKLHEQNGQPYPLIVNARDNYEFSLIS
jgi:hypothetical protein